VYPSPSADRPAPRMDSKRAICGLGDIFLAPGQVTGQDRQRLRVLPGLEVGLGKLALGVAGDLN